MAIHEFEPPSFPDIQLQSYGKFLQRHVLPSKRINDGLHMLFHEAFPFSSIDGKVKIEYIRYAFGREKFSPRDCKRRGMTFSAPLKLSLRLTTTVDIKEQDVYIPDFPLLTDAGTFIINGKERVLLPQILNSPGIYFKRSLDSYNRKIFSAKIIPDRGITVEIDYIVNDVILVVINRINKFPLSQILRILGLADNEELELVFGDDFKKIRPTLEIDKTENRDEALVDFIQTVRNDKVSTAEDGEILFNQLFLDPKAYNFSRAGAYAIRRKLKISNDVDIQTLDLSLVIEIIQYLFSFTDTDDFPVDILSSPGNWRIATAGDLIKEEIRSGLKRMETIFKERTFLLENSHDITAHHYIHGNLILNRFRLLLSNDRFCPLLDQTNPVAEISQKRCLYARVSFPEADSELDNVDAMLLYGRICLFEFFHGLDSERLLSLALLARINEEGFLETPYCKVSTAHTELKYLTIDEERDKYIATFPQKQDYIEGSEIQNSTTVCRFNGKLSDVLSINVEYADVSAQQTLSVTASLVPFLEHNNPELVSKIVSSLRQALPLINAEAPLILSGMEKRVAIDSGAAIVAKEKGVVQGSDQNRILIGQHVYDLTAFSSSNHCMFCQPLVKIGDEVNKGQVIAENLSSKKGVLSLGCNLLFAFMPWHGFNFSNSILISERLVREERFASVSIESIQFDCFETEYGKEEFTCSIPGIDSEELVNLDDDGIIRKGSKVQEGSILAGKKRPEDSDEDSPELKLLKAVFKSKKFVCEPLRLLHGISGIVVDVELLQANRPGRPEKKPSIARKNEKERIQNIKNFYANEIKNLMDERNKKLSELMGISEKVASKIEMHDFEEFSEGREICSVYYDRIYDLRLQEKKEIDAKLEDGLPHGVVKRVIIYIAVKRNIDVGDLLSTRHGSCGAVARILPVENMPFLADGTPVDVVFNPSDVINNMNAGLLLESQLGWAAKALGQQFISPPLEGLNLEKIFSLMEQAGLPADGKTILYDGQTGDPFDQKVSVGYVYTYMLDVDNESKARSTGPYALISQQPVGNKNAYGGEKFGESEIEALEAYGAAYALQEMLTVKSDDIMGRNNIYEAIFNGEMHLKFNLPESVKTLLIEMQGLCLDVKFHTSEEL